MQKSKASPRQAFERRERPGDGFRNYVAPPLTRKKMYTSCESINFDAYGSPPPVSSMQKRKMYMSCEALNTSTDVHHHHYENPESYFRNSREGTRNNNTIKGYISHHQDHQQQQHHHHHQQQQLRRTDRSIMQHYNTNSHSASSKKQQEHTAMTKTQRPPLHTHVSVDIETRGHSHDAKMFNSSSVPCLLDCPDQGVVHGENSGTGVHSHARGTSRGRTYALSGVPPHAHPPPPSVHNQTGHKVLIKPIALKPVPADHTPGRYPPTSSYSPRNQQALRRASPQAYNDVMKTTPTYSNSQDDGYISQECHSRTNSNNSSLQKPLQQQTAQVMSAQSSPQLRSQHESHSRTSSTNGSLQRPNRQGAQVLSQSSQNSPKPHSQDTPKVTYLTDSGQKMVSSLSSSHSDSGRPESLNSSSNLSRRVSRDSLPQPAAMLDSSYIPTPSPSDLSLNDLEGIIRDKDAQIRQLRETMERNETAILQVCEEKEQNWEMRFHELRSEWEKKLRLQQQKAFKMEQALLMQLFKLQQERKSTRAEKDTLRTEKERVERHATDLQEDAKTARTKLEETQWDLCQKVGEISHLKVRIKESKESLAQKSSEVLSLKAQMKDVQRDNEEKNTEILGLESELKKSREGRKHMQQTLDNMHRQLSKSNSNGKVQDNEASAAAIDANSSQEVANLQEEIAKSKVEYEADKDRWLAEKEKVIRYQRHLQLNYVQMANKNKVLEAEVQQLTLELEGRDLCLEGTKIEGEGEESIC